MESGQRAMELAIAPEFTLCPTADLTIYLSIYLRPTAVESGQRAMELAIAPEFTLCPTADLTMAMLKKVKNIFYCAGLYT